MTFFGSGLDYLIFENFIVDKMILKISNAVAAIIEVKDHGIFQKEIIKNIWYPNKLEWFGGGVKDESLQLIH